VPTFSIENFGCRASQADGASISRQFADRGVESTSADTADLVVLNTCTVTADADRAARAAIRRIHSRNPNARILVTGCYAQRAPSEIAALPGVTCVVGNSHKHTLAALALPSTPFVPMRTLLESSPAAGVYVGDIFAHTELLAAPVFGFAETAPGDTRTRPNLKVQDGCNNRCSFCIIPSVRGQSRSRSLPRVIDDINNLVASGSREVVISGINLGRWGRDLTPALRFEILVEAILDQTTLEKLRLSSVEPMDWSDDLVALIRSTPRIARHAHVPMQSGSDAVLRRMHRKYRPWHYREKITKIREALPTAAIGADVMTGFPGETDGEFEQTRRMVEDLPLTYLHIFPYSPRPATPAAALADQVPVHTARQRHHVLRDLISQKKQSFARSIVGQTVPAITLQSPTAESSNALTDNYLELHLAGRHEPNNWIQAFIEATSGATLLGRPI
jgi:threonylcarbamoyladenosine tRNA methylthiotransferase MtaB